MTGYYYECPHCSDVIPLNIADLGHHGTRPDVECYDCGEQGCVTCMPDEVCDACQDRIAEDEQYDWEDDPDSLAETYLNDSGD